MDPLAGSPVFDVIDVTRPHPARMYDYYLGGKDHWQPTARPRTGPGRRTRSPRHRPGQPRLPHRAVRYLARDKGVTQFLDIGTGIPTSPNVHETAADYVAGPRVVYADNDPVIHAHANALLTGTGTTRIVLADLRDPEKIIAGARGFLDFTQAGRSAPGRDPPFHPRHRRPGRHRRRLPRRPPGAGQFPGPVPRHHRLPSRPR